MDKEESITISKYGELKELKEEYISAKRKLKRDKSGARRKELEEYVNDLKSNWVGPSLTMESMSKALRYSNRFHGGAMGR